MVNGRYEPDEREEIILELSKQGGRSGSLWGRVNPLYLCEHSDLEKGQAECALRDLTDAGWITQLNQGGLCELVGDPRDGFLLAALITSHVT